MWARDHKIHKVAAWHLRIRNFWCGHHEREAQWVYLRPLLHWMSAGWKLLSLVTYTRKWAEKASRRGHRYLPRLPGTSLKRITCRNVPNYPLSKLASQAGSLYFLPEAEIHLFERHFGLNYQAVPFTRLRGPLVIGELGPANHCYWPLLFPHQKPRLSRVHLAMSTGAHVPKFVKWAPIRGDVIRRKEGGNKRVRANPGQDPSP